MTISGVCELTLVSEDVPGLARFYRRAFDLPVLAVEDDRIWLAAGPSCRLGIWAPGAKEFGDRGGRHVHFALAVNPGTLDAMHARLVDLGLDATGLVEHSGGDRSLCVHDPLGNVVELWDFFDRQAGATHGVAALAGDGQDDLRASDVTRPVAG